MDGVALVPYRPPLPERPKLLLQVRHALRARHLSRRTEKQYVAWIKRFVRFHDLRHPLELGKPEVEAFLSDLAVRGQVSASTQNQALAALIFLYRVVLEEPLPWLSDVVRAKPAVRVPVVLTRPDVGRLLAVLEGTQRLIGVLLYGAGLRLMEVMQLRVYDIDFAGGSILVRSGKGAKDRFTVLPQLAIAPLRTHLLTVRAGWEEDRARREPVRVRLPDALARKFRNAELEWGWRWVFPAARIHVDSAGVHWRHHLHETVMQRAVREAVQRSGLSSRASCHTLRHSFATHLLEDGYTIRKVQELLGHLPGPALCYNSGPRPFYRGGAVPPHWAIQPRAAPGSCAQGVGARDSNHQRSFGHASGTRQL